MQAHAGSKKTKVRQCCDADECNCPKHTFSLRTIGGDNNIPFYLVNAGDDALHLKERDDAHATSSRTTCRRTHRSSSVGSQGSDASAAEVGASPLRCFQIEKPLFPMSGPLTLTLKINLSRKAFAIWPNQMADDRYDVFYNGDLVESSFVPKTMMPSENGNPETVLVSGQRI